MLGPKEGVREHGGRGRAPTLPGEGGQGDVACTLAACWHPMHVLGRGQTERGCKFGDRCTTTLAGLLPCSGAARTQTAGASSS